MNGVLFGPPGSGKGTQAGALCEHFAMTHVSTGDMLREAVRNGTELGKKAQSIMAEGKLVPDDLVGGVVREKILDLTARDRGILFDGYPRNLEQALFLDSCLEEAGTRIHVAAVLEIAEEELVKRICGRRLCTRSGCTGAYNVYFMAPKTEGKCDLCGSDLMQRKDDNEATLRERLEVYNGQTRPLLEYYEEKDLLIRVAANGSVSDIRQSLLAKIEEKQGGSR
ncbi:adenylate kinase [Candidatus Sumerlaeota bacterium]|nr:adenylate kinase [Candidatus Sumerlaeota bacterium]